MLEKKTEVSRKIKKYIRKYAGTLLRYAHPSAMETTGTRKKFFSLPSVNACIDRLMLQHLRTNEHVVDTCKESN